MKGDLNGAWLTRAVGRMDPSPRVMKMMGAGALVLLFVAGVVLGLNRSVVLPRGYISRAVFIVPNTSTVAAGFDRRPREPSPSMSDDEFLQRASMMAGRVPKVAFMFLTRGPLPLAPLWERFFHGHEAFFSVYVHAAPGYDFDVPTTSAFHGRQIPSKNTSWGSITLVDAERRLLANALLDFSNERFVLLSETCIPLFDFPTVYAYLLNSSQSFVESYDSPSHRARGRYSSRMTPEITVRDWRKGSQWFEMSRALAVRIVAESKYRAIFERYCKPSCFPDEHYFATYINMFHGDLNSNRTVTWVDWSRLHSHPAMFRAENVTADFVRSIRDNSAHTCTYNSKPTHICYLFARKFAASALEPLLNFSSLVMKY